MTSGKTSRQGREGRAAQARAAAARAESRRRNGIRLGVALVVVLVVVGFGVLIQTQRGNQKTGSSNAAPANTSGPANGAITVGQASAPVTVKAYEDFQCPICKDFEASSAPTLQKLVDDGTIKLEYHPISFLDRMSSTKYSTRALNAAGCVINAKPSAFPAFHTLLFENQPAENSAGAPDSDLVAWAKQAGAGDISSCVKAGTYDSWTVRVTDQASKDGVNGTPTVFVNGKQLENPTPDTLTAAIQAAKK